MYLGEPTLGAAAAINKFCDSTAIDGILVTDFCSKNFPGLSIKSITADTRNFSQKY